MPTCHLGLKSNLWIHRIMVACREETLMDRMSKWTRDRWNKTIKENKFVVTFRKLSNQSQAWKTKEESIKQGYS